MYHRSNFSCSLTKNITGKISCRLDPFLSFFGYDKSIDSMDTKKLTKLSIKSLMIHCIKFFAVRISTFSFSERLVYLLKME